MGRWIVILLASSTVMFFASHWFPGMHNVAIDIAGKGVPWTVIFWLGTVLGCSRLT
jgi:predicted transcriptional regulator